MAKENVKLGIFHNKWVFWGTVAVLLLVVFALGAGGRGYGYGMMGRGWGDSDYGYGMMSGYGPFGGHHMLSGYGMMGGYGMMRGYASSTYMSGVITEITGAQIVISDNGEKEHVILSTSNTAIYSDDAQISVRSLRAGDFIGAWGTSAAEGFFQARIIQVLGQSVESGQKVTAVEQ